MKLARLVRFAMCAAFVAFTTAESCGPLCILEDCVAPANGLDGRWELTTINGARIETLRPGFRIPNSANYVVEASIRFTSSVWDEDRHSGTALYSYSAVDAVGADRTFHSYTGVFEYYPKTGQLRLSVDENEGNATVSGTTITAARTFAVFGSAIVLFVKAH